MSKRLWENLAIDLRWLRVDVDDDSVWSEHVKRTIDSIRHGGNAKTFDEDYFRYFVSVPIGDKPMIRSTWRKLL